jgi:hypothetical protein
MRERFWDEELETASWEEVQAWQGEQLADTLRAVSEPAVTEAERRAQTER